MAVRQPPGSPPVIHPSGHPSLLSTQLPSLIVKSIFLYSCGPSVSSGTRAWRQGTPSRNTCTGGRQVHQHPVHLGLTGPSTPPQGADSASFSVTNETTRVLDQDLRMRSNWKEREKQTGIAGIGHVVHWIGFLLCLLNGEWRDSSCRSFRVPDNSPLLILASLTSRMEGWKNLPDKRCILPNCFRFRHVHPVNEPLYVRFIVREITLGCRIATGATMIVPLSSTSGKSGLGTSEGPQIFLQLTNMKDIA